jgi:RNA polymerase sigma-70 factor (ECF subfamily)
MPDRRGEASGTISRAEENPSFERFFESHYLRLLKGLVLATGDQAEAEDLLQEAFARAFERWARVAHMESPESYVYVTALNLNRRRFRRIARSLVPAGERTSDPETIAETRESLIQALQTVSREQREALVMVGWLGLSVEEAARALGIQPESVRSRIHRARVTLRQEMSES